MNYYKRHLGDYAKNTRTLTTYEHGVYTLLLDLYYTDEEPLTFEDAVAVCRADGAKEKAAVSRVLSRYFVELDGRWHNSRADEEIAKYHDKSIKNAEIGRLGGKQKAKRNASESVSETLIESPHERLANDNPSHKPLANSQEEAKAKDGADAPVPIDPVKAIFDRGVSLIGGDGRSARGVVGRLRKTHGDEVVMQAILRGEEVQPSDPIPWLIKACEAGSAPKPFGDLDDWMARNGYTEADYAGH